MFYLAGLLKQAPTICSRTCRLRFTTSRFPQSGTKYWCPRMVSDLRPASPLEHRRMVPHLHGVVPGVPVGSRWQLSQRLLESFTSPLILLMTATNQGFLFLLTTFLSATRLVSAHPLLLNGGRLLTRILLRFNWNGGKVKISRKVIDPPLYETLVKQLRLRLVNKICQEAYADGFKCIQLDSLVFVTIVFLSIYYLL